jgi:hypothetical protein
MFILNSLSKLNGPRKRAIIRGNDMQTISYETGRDYGAPQVLEITFPAVATDDFQLVAVKFVDAARRISGIVEVFDIDVTLAKIGRAVLAEYDAGRYQAA